MSEPTTENLDQSTWQAIITSCHEYKTGLPLLNQMMEEQNRPQDVEGVIKLIPGHMYYRDVMSSINRRLNKALIPYRIKHVTRAHSRRCKATIQVVKHERLHQITVSLDSKSLEILNEEKLTRGVSVDELIRIAISKLK